jgi:hypothetical protein
VSLLAEAEDQADVEAQVLLAARDVMVVLGSRDNGAMAWPTYGVQV